MKCRISFLSLFFIFIPISIFAQKKNVEKSSSSNLTAEQLIYNYRFDEAISKLQREIDVAQRAGKDVERLESDLHRANLGADMLRGVERIIFIDSVKTARSSVLKSLHLSHEVGEVVNTETQLNFFEKNPANCGKISYINELNDRIFFAATDSIEQPKNIWSAYRLGEKWSQAQPLSGLQNSSEDQDFPFIMPDGVTLYFAAQGEQSLGGYDLFVTRYDSESKQYLKAENVGMPFNSPANDYMLIIDEYANLGWFVTDRNQDADSVCIYIFIPNENREIYDYSKENEKEVLNAARLHSISMTQSDSNAVREARMRLQKVTENSIQPSLSHQRYIISDEQVYDNLNQFKSETAKRIAEQANQVGEEIERLSARHEKLQFITATQGRTSQIEKEMQQINKQLPPLREQYHTLCKNMRAAELK